MKINQTIDKVWLVKSDKSRLFKELTIKLKNNNISYSLVPRVAFQRKYGVKNHQGVVAKISPIEIIPESKGSKTKMILGGIGKSVTSIWDKVLNFFGIIVIGALVKKLRSN